MIWTRISAYAQRSGPWQIHAARSGGVLHYGLTREGDLLAWGRVKVLRVRYFDSAAQARETAEREQGMDEERANDGAD